MCIRDSDGIINATDGFFTNESSGIITINDIAGGQNEGIDNRFAFVNFGQIDITNIDGAPGIVSALIPSAIFANHGVLNIENINSRGLWVHTNGQFLNKPTGQLNISNIVGDDAIEVLQNFENEGIIDIDEVSGPSADGIDSRNTFVNTGTISIQNVDDSHGIFNTSFFTNDVGGVIDIDFFHDEGLRNEANGTFTNKGDISINQNSSATNSHGILNFGRILSLIHIS